MKSNLKDEKRKIIIYNRNKKNLKHVLRLILFYIRVITVLASLLVSYFWMVSGSFKSSNEILISDCTISGQEPLWFPKKFTFDNYLKVNETIPMFQYLKNSFYISGGTMIFTTLISMFAAYGMSRIRFAYKKHYEIFGSFRNVGKDIHK